MRSLLSHAGEDVPVGAFGGFVGCGSLSGTAGLGDSFPGFRAEVPGGPLVCSSDLPPPTPLCTSACQGAPCCELD